jgi:hypothetical protein
MKKALRSFLISLVGRLFGRAVASCEEAGRLTSEARDRLLTPRERNSIRIHNKLCRECSKYARQLEVLGAVASEENPEAQLPESLRRKLIEALNKENPRGE